MRWSYWGASGEVPEEVGQLRQEGFQSTAWKGTHIPTYVYAFVVLWPHMGYACLVSFGVASAILSDRS